MKIRDKIQEFIEKSFWWPYWFAIAFILCATIAVFNTIYNNS